jgi:hypothetical protein
MLRGRNMEKVRRVGEGRRRKRARREERILS